MARSYNSVPTMRSSGDGAVDPILTRRIEARRPIRVGACPLRSRCLAALVVFAAVLVPQPQCFACTGPALGSCTDWFLAGSTTSGLYCVRPPNAGGNIQVYCDHSEGGGWMLLWSYAHAGGTTPPLVPGVLPTDPVNGFSHARACNDVGYRQGDIESVRFYCETSGHPRKIHFRTENSKVVDGACRVGSTPNTAVWTVGDWANNIKCTTEFQQNFCRGFCWMAVCFRAF
jgi:hypothetical protein